MPQLDFETWLYVLSDMDFFSIVFYIVVVVFVVFNVSKILFLQKLHEEWVFGTLQGLLSYMLTSQIGKEAVSSDKNHFIVAVSTYFLSLLELEVMEYMLGTCDKLFRFNFNLIADFFMRIICRLSNQVIISMKTNKIFLKVKDHVDLYVEYVPFVNSLVINNTALFFYK